MKQYYVYVLIDPLNDEFFYVGKGKGRRAEEHEKANTNRIENDKNNHIESIQERKSHNKVKNRVIGRFDTEDEAFAVESVLIKWMYGLHSLTNEVHGHRHKNIRPFGNLDEIQDLDIEKKINQNDGLFTKELMIGNDIYNIEDKLTHLRSELLKFNPKLKISSPDLTRPKDPAIYIEINKFTKCQLILNASGNDTVIFNIRPSDNKKNSRERFILDYDKNSGNGTYDVKVKKTAPYLKLKGWLKYNPHYKNEFSEIKDRINLVLIKFTNQTFQEK